ncbi:MAG: YraN family protein [Oscillospiraceae bacterium]
MSSGGDRKLLGRWGEATVAEDMRKNGWSIIAAGFSTRFGEIDLIATNDTYLSFTEVKLRRDSRFAQAREFVDGKKQERLRTTAEQFLAKYPTQLQPRFDVVEVYAPQGMETEHPIIRYFENAF